MDHIRQIQDEIQSQRRLIASQSEQLVRQQREIERLRREVSAAPPPTGLAQQAADRSTATETAQAPLPSRSRGSTAPPPDLPVGEAPTLATVEQQVQAVPEGAGVLTRAGHFVLEPSLEYTNSSNNRLVFRGIELIPGIQIGLIEASMADRDTFVATATVRYGLADNLEIEARVPYLFRSDRVEGMQQRDDATTQVLRLHQRRIGDIEFGLRYQFNRPVGERPIFVGSLRVKTDTGKSPFAVPFDDAGVATGLATGSGFWGVQTGLNFLLPSDPAVIFGGVSYLYNIPRTIDRSIGGVLIGRTDPGDAISGNIGFGFALNPRFSFSLGYEHNYILPTRWEIGDANNRSSRLQVGSFVLGMSYRITRRQSLNLGFEFGATEAAPDLSMILRIPFTPE